MKQILHKLTLAMAIMFAAITVSAYDFEVDGIYYNVLSLADMTCEVTEGDNKYNGDMVIPEEVSYNNRTFSVAGIGNGAFSQCVKLESIYIPKSVKSIGSSAFDHCSSLESIALPNSIAIIEDETFNCCFSLKNVTIPESVESIGSYAFSSCHSLETVTIPNSVTYIGIRAFGFCQSLENVIIPNSVTYLGTCAFGSCKSLNVILSNNLEYITYGVFNDTPNLSLVIPGSVNSICQYTAPYKNPGDSARGNYTFYSFDRLQILYSPETLQAGYVLSKTDEFITGNWACESVRKGLDIKELSIDRRLEREMYLDNLEKLELGETIQEVQIENLDTQEDLTTIQCHGLVPPKLPNMSNFQYMNVNVFVPEEALEAYKADENWGKFWNLQGSGVEGVNIDSKKDVSGSFDMNGRSVSEDYKGIVIVRFSDGSYRKMLNQ